MCGCNLHPIGSQLGLAKNIQIQSFYIDTKDNYVCLITTKIKLHIHLKFEVFEFNRSQMTFLQKIISSLVLALSIRWSLNTEYTYIYKVKHIFSMNKNSE